MNNVPSAGGLRHPMDLSQIVNTAIKVYRQNFGEFLAIATLALPAYIAFAIAVGTKFDPVRPPRSIYPIAALLLLSGIIVNAAIMRAVGDIADGRSPDFYRSYRSILPCLGSLLLGALLVVTVGVIGAFTVIGLPLTIFFWVRWFFLLQGIMIDNLSLKDSLSFSMRIVQDSWWRTLGILVSIIAFSFLPAIAVGVLFSWASPIGSALVAAVTAVVIQPFTTIADTLLFFDLQSRERERVSAA